MDRQEFSKVFHQLLQVLDERDALKDALRIAREQFQSHQAMSASQLADVQQKLVSMDVLLRNKTALARSLSEKYLQLHEAFLRSEREKGKIGERARALSFSTAVGLADADADEHRRAIALSILATNVDYSAETASTAVAELLRLSGPPIGNISFITSNTEGTRIVGGSKDLGLFLWETKSGQLLKATGERLAGNVSDVMQRPRIGDRIFTFGDHGEVSVWSCTTLELLRTWKVPGIKHHAFWRRELSDDGSVLLEWYGSSARSHEIRAWDTMRGEKIWELSNFPNSRTFAISSDGRSVVTAEDIREVSRVTVWRTGQSQPVRTYITRRVGALRGGSRGRVFGVVESRKGPEIWDLTNKTNTRALAKIPDYRALEVHLWGGDRALVVGLTSCRMVQIDSSSTIFTIPSHFEQLIHDPSSRLAIFSLGGRTLFADFNANTYLHLSEPVSHGSFAPNSSLFVGHTKTGLTALKTPAGVPVWSREINVHVSHPPIVSRRSADIRLSDIRYDDIEPMDRPKTETWRAARVRFDNSWQVQESVSFNSERPSVEYLSENGRFLAQCYWNNGCVVKNYSTGQQVGSFMPGNVGLLEKLFVSGDGTNVMIATAKEVVVWTVSSGSSRVVLKLRDDRYGMAVTPDFRIAAIGYLDGCVEIANVREGTREKIGDCVSAIESIDLSESGETLAIGRDDGRVQIWELPSHRQLGAFQLANTVARIAISKNSEFVAAASVPRDAAMRSNVRVWSLKTQKLAVESSNFGEAMSMGFSADGETLVVANMNRAIAIPVTQRSVAQALCRLLAPASVSESADDPAVMATKICAEPMEKRK